MFLSSARTARRLERIAFIPQTEGTYFWESAHTGAEAAAEQTGSFIYWNAPTREDDVEAQSALVDQVVADGYQGLVLAPDQALSLISPVRRALLQNIVTVIIGSPLSIPPGGDLAYILNDDDEGGRLAAQRVAELVRGRGVVAVLGIDPDVPGTEARAHAFEKYLAKDSPHITIAEKLIGTFSVPHEQQIAEDTLRTHPDVNVIIALMSSTVDGALSAVRVNPRKRAIKIIGFDISGAFSFDRNSSLDCVIQENTRAMGEQSIRLIHAKLLGQSIPVLTYLHPELIDRENYKSAHIRQMFSQDWTLGHWRWSSVQ